MRFVFRALIALLLLSGAGLAAGLWLTRPVSPDAFLEAPRAGLLPAEPGRLLRREPFRREVPANARAWRVLYTTTRFDGRPAVASAIVLTAREPSPTPRPVIAWLHGTTGVVAGCAPSQLAQPFAYVPALPALIDQGWVFVAPDYAGLSTDTHGYLVGEDEARSALDAVRAAQQIEALQLDVKRTVVWGHSQGGHAALWTGQIAARYAPDIPLLGVASLSPAASLLPMLESVAQAPIGVMFSAFVLRAYAGLYADVRLDDYVRPPVRTVVDLIGNRCLSGRDAYVLGALALLPRGGVFQRAPSEGALAERLAQNTPTGRIEVPLWVTQGLTDTLVTPPVQHDYVKRLCAAGQALTYQTYAGQDHTSIVGPASPLNGDLVRWTQARLAGEPVPGGCTGLD